MKLDEAKNLLMRKNVVQRAVQSTNREILQTGFPFQLGQNQHASEKKPIQMQQSCLST